LKHTIGGWLVNDDAKWRWKSYSTSPRSINNIINPNMASSSTEPAASAALYRLVVSNIAWNPSQDAQVYQWLYNAGVRNLELAPTKRWPEWQMSIDDARQWGSQVGQHGFTVPSLQAILFNRPDLHLFTTDHSRHELLLHLQRVIDVAEAIADAAAAAAGRPAQWPVRLVFGAPKNRLLNGAAPDLCDDVAVAFFGDVAQYAARHRCCVCLEPNPEAYACQWANRAAWAQRIVQRVGHPGFALHLDTACMHLALDDLRASITHAAEAHALAHLHISEPFLGQFADPKVDHALVANTLATSCYSGFLSIEMRDDPSGENNLQNVQRAVQYVAETYKIPLAHEAFATAAAAAAAAAAATGCVESTTTTNNV
jgi:D-psicose/D-tagatose/L-ribulose 3-epimerase